MGDLSALFEPRSIAIVGASSDPGKLGGRPVDFLKRYGFTGAIYPVNASAGEIQGLPAFSAVREIPGDVDQAIVVVPAAAVEAAVADCLAKKVPVVQILSAGFGEAGDEGRAAQDRMVAAAREAGVRLTGPNALGALSPGNGLFATFASALNGLRPTAGSIAVVTQSGAFGSCTYVMASLRNLGLSRVIATGNEADIDVAECIEWLADDPATSVICAALESCNNGPGLRRALLAAAKARKPVVIMKVGTSDIGATAAATHTGSLAGDDAAFDAVFRECGAFRASSIEDMIDVAYLISVGGLPVNDQLAVLTLSGGIGILMADTAIDSGMTLPSLPEDTRRAIWEVIPFGAGDNPLDTTANIAAKRTAVGDVASLMLDGTGAGTLVSYLANNGLAPEIFRPQQEAVLAMKAKHPDRVVACVMPSLPEVRSALEAGGVTVFEDPSRAVKAVAAASSFHARWNAIAHGKESTQEELSPVPPLPDVLDETTAKAYLSASGIPSLDERLCTTSAQAVAAAEAVGYPVVAKIVSPDIIHKTEIGGVQLGLSDASAVERAFDELVANAARHAPTAVVNGVVVSPMVNDGVETILGVHTDAVFGPMLMYGLGGVMVELYRDVAFASIPLSRADAERLITRVRGSQLLSGWRGSSPMDTEALIDAICSLSALVDGSDEIEAIDINPFVVRPHGTVALDAVITRRSRVGQ